MWRTNAAPVDDVEGAEAEWQRAHRALSRLARERAAADAEEGRWLLSALRSAAHVHLGFGSFHEYVERLFGYSPRSTQEKLRVAEALEQLPAMTGSLEQGQLSWSAVRELTRVAVADTEHEWLRVAVDKTVRQLEALVAGTSPGDLPWSPPDRALRPRVLRFEVTADTYALFREGVSQLRRQSDAHLDDDALLLTMARAALQGPSDEGRSSYQVSLSVCTACGRTSQLAAGELVPVAPEIAAMGECDGQHIGALAGAAMPDGPATNDVRPDNDGPGGTACGAHVCATSPDAHAGAPETTLPKRAKQTIPPAKRRAAMQRDQRHCRVPGCRNASFVDVHHIAARADGGSNDVHNLLVLCGAHHRAVHRGELVIEGNTAGRVSFQHTDGSRYGEPASPTRIDVQTKVFKALCKLGFRDGEVRRVLVALRLESGAEQVSAEGLLREALSRLTSPG